MTLARDRLDRASRVSTLQPMDPQKPDRSERLNVRFSADEARMLKAVAALAGLTASDIVRTLIRREYRATIGETSRATKRRTR